MSEITEAEYAKIILRSQKDPIFFCEEILKVKTLQWPQHREALMSFVDNDIVAIKSGHSMGKDFISGLVSLWFLYCFAPAVVITTAPSQRQVEKIIWGEITKYFNPALPGRLKTQEIEIAEDWYALGFTTKETNQMIGKFQGFKGKNVLVVVTEAQAVEDNIYDQIDGIMTANNSKLYLAGNPLMNTGEFAKAFTRKNVKKFTWSCYDSPNYIADKEVIPGMVGRKWVEDKEKKWGKGSPLFQARVLGEFPKQSIYSLISLDECMKAVDAEPQKGRKVLSGDIARYGDDSTILTVLDGGDMIDQVEQQGKPTTQTEGLATNLIIKHDPQDVVMDEGAMGAGVVDHLEEGQKEMKSKHSIEYDLYGFNFGGKAEDSKFANKGTEAWFYSCEAIKKGKVRLMDDPELFSQLSSRKYKFDLKGRIILESKEDMKKKGLPSPDKADALIMGLYLSLEGQTDYGDGEGEDDYSYLEAQIDPRTGYVNTREPYRGGIRV